MMLAHPPCSWLILGQGGMGEGSKKGICLWVISWRKSFIHSFIHSFIFIISQILLEFMFSLSKLLTQSEAENLGRTLSFLLTHWSLWQSKFRALPMTEAHGWWVKSYAFVSFNRRKRNESGRLVSSFCNKTKTKRIILCSLSLLFILFFNLNYI